MPEENLEVAKTQGELITVQSHTSGEGGEGNWPWNPAFATYNLYDLENVLPPLYLNFFICKVGILIIPVSRAGENSTTEPPVQAT